MTISRAQFLKTLGVSALGLGLGAAGAHAVETALAAAGGRHLRRAATPFSVGDRLDCRIALTFEDGPTPVVTSGILAEFKARQIPATFFVVGQRVEAEPELVRKMVAEGHEVGSHGFSHAPFYLLPQATITRELQQTQAAVFAAAGVRPRWCRPPGETLSEAELKLVQAESLQAAGWDVHPGHLTESDPAGMARAITAQTRGGSIIRLHDQDVATPSCLAATLDALSAAGFRFVTVSTLAGRLA